MIGSHAYIRHTRRAYLLWSLVLFGEGFPDLAELQGGPSGFRTFAFACGNYGYSRQWRSVVSLDANVKRKFGL